MSPRVTHPVAQIFNLLYRRFSTCAAYLRDEVNGMAVGVRLYGAFPLTPALSLRERENRSPTQREGVRHLSPRFQRMSE